MGILKKKTAKNIKMVAVVQCGIALERCSGFHCAWAFQRRRDYFSGYARNVTHLSLSCGGCPGRRLSRLLSNLAKCAKKKEGWGKDQIEVRLAACIINDNSHYPRCPFTGYMKAIIRQKGFNVIEGGYESCTARDCREQNRYNYPRFLYTGEKNSCDGVKNAK